MAEINLVGIGFVIIFIGLMLIIAGSLGNKDVKVGVGGFIGPIPFGFANDERMFQTIIILTIIVTLVFMFLALKGFKI